MVDGGRIDCPLCDKSYQDNNRGRGHLKKHARKVHVPKKPVEIKRFRYWDDGKWVDGETHWYACPFLDCGKRFLSSIEVWYHFRRYDHFGLLIKKVKMKGRGVNAEGRIACAPMEKQR